VRAETFVPLCGNPVLLGCGARLTKSVGWEASHGIEAVRAAGHIAQAIADADDAIG
jgi:hypothetical protein